MQRSAQYGATAHVFGVVGVGAAPGFAFVLEFLLPFGRPRGRLTGWPSVPSSSPGRFVPVAALAVSACNRSALRYLSKAGYMMESATRRGDNGRRCMSASVGRQGHDKTRRTHSADFSSSVVWRLGSGGWPSSCRRRSTSCFARVYSPSVMDLIFDWRSLTLRAQENAYSQSLRIRTRRQAGCSLLIEGSLGKVGLVKKCWWLGRGCRMW